MVKAMRSKRPRSSISQAARWEAMRAKLAVFEAEHGHCRVSLDPNLSTWVSHQRAAKKKLDAGQPSPGTTAERVAQLEALGFEWSPAFTHPDEAGWDAMRARLAAFKAEHGHCRVPRNHVADPKLGTWVKNQRAYKKRLDTGHPSPQITAERVAKLDALGFEWVAPTADEAGWGAMRARLAAFKAEHGHCRVPRSHPADPKLAGWVHDQRQRKRRLDANNPNPWITPERVAKLDALGFEWSPPIGGGAGKFDEVGWEAMRARQVAFKAEHGHCRVPSEHSADPKLGWWVSQQRVYKKRLEAGHPKPKITNERVAKLDALGFEWDASKRMR